MERDQAAGVTSIAATLGPRRAWQVHAVVHVLVSVVAVVGLVALGRPLLVAVVATGIPAAVIGLGVAVSRGATPQIRERGWRLEAVGTGLLAAAWLWLAVAVPG